MKQRKKMVIKKEIFRKLKNRFLNNIGIGFLTGKETRKQITITGVSIPKQISKPLYAKILPRELIKAIKTQKELKDTIGLCVYKPFSKTPFLTATDIETFNTLPKRFCNVVFGETGKWKSFRGVK